MAEKDNKGKDVDEKDIKWLGRGQEVNYHLDLK